MDTKDFDVVAMRTDLHQIPELGFNESAHDHEPRISQKRCQGFGKTDS